jgi:hypothetical protein
MTTDENILYSLGEILSIQQRQLEAMQQMARTLQRILETTDVIRETVENIEFRQGGRGPLAGP